nr:hypothetical protein [uncultured Vibrio sp.]
MTTNSRGNLTKVISAIILATISITFPFKSYAVNFNPLECALSEVVETPVTFFVHDDLKHITNTQDKINEWIEWSNITLKNSCIPLKRIFKKVIYLANDPYIYFSDLTTSERYLRLKYKEEFDFIDSDIGHYYGIVFPGSSDAVCTKPCGITKPGLVPNYFHVKIQDSCPGLLLEHELGHLAGAMHRYKEVIRPNSSFKEWRESRSVWLQSMLKEYGFAYRCGSYGSVMASCRNTILPFYSTPKISINGEKCGDEHTANNTKLMLEHYEKIKKMRVLNGKYTATD